MKKLTLQKIANQIKLSDTISSIIASDGFSNSFGITDGLGYGGISPIGDNINWSQVVGTFVTTGNVLKPSSATNTLAVIDSGVTDHEIEFYLNLTGSNKILSFVRYTDTSNHLKVQVHANRTIKITKLVGGVATDFSTTSYPDETDLMVTVTCIGSELTVKINGNTIKTETLVDSILLSATSVGVNMNDTTTYIDNFNVIRK